MPAGSAMMSALAVLTNARKAGYSSYHIVDAQIFLGGVHAIDAIGAFRYWPEAGCLLLESDEENISLYSINAKVKVAVHF